MKEYLFLRFFSDKDDQIPMDSVKVGHKSVLKEGSLIGEDEIHLIENWMVGRPNGKVDFLWASAEGIM